MTKEGQAELEAVINLSQSLVASKIIETTLGLPGLSAQLLSPLSSLDFQTVHQEGTKEQKQYLEQLQGKIEQKFLSEGFPQEEARFLGQVGVLLSEQGLLTPAAASIPTVAAINQLLLIASVKAALVLSKMPLQEADSLAHEAVEDTLAETPSSPRQSSSAPNWHPTCMIWGMGDKGEEIAKEAVLIPPKENALTAKPIASHADVMVILEKGCFNYSHRNWDWKQQKS